MKLNSASSHLVFLRRHKEQNEEVRSLPLRRRRLRSWLSLQGHLRSQNMRQDWIGWFTAPLPFSTAAHHSLSSTERVQRGEVREAGSHLPSGRGRESGLHPRSLRPRSLRWKVRRRRGRQRLLSAPERSVSALYSSETETTKV